MVFSGLLPTVLFFVVATAWTVVIASLLYDLVPGLVRGNRVHVAGLLGVLALAVILRLVLATWGPGDDQFRVPEVLSYDMSGNPPPALNYHLGHAYGILYYFVFLIVPFSLTWVVVGNMALGSLACVLVVLLLKELRASGTAAFGAGLLLSIQPLVVRHSGEASRPSFVLFSALVALWYLARHRQRGGLRHLATFVAAAVLCCTSRPEGGTLVLVAGLMVLCAFPLSQARLWSPTVRSELFAVVLAGILGVMNLLINARHEPAISGHLSDLSPRVAYLSARYAPWLDTDYTSVAVMAVVMVGTLLGLWRRSRLVLWGVVSLVLVALIRSDECTSSLWDIRPAYARYFTLPLLLFSILGGLGLHELLGRNNTPSLRVVRNVPAVLLSAAIIASTIQPMANVTMKRTIDHEHKFLLQALPQLPRNTVLVQPFDDEPGFTGAFQDLDELSRLTDGPVWQEWPPVPTGTHEHFFYRSPACHMSWSGLLMEQPQALYILLHCTAGMLVAGDSPVLTTRIPAAPWGPETYVSEEMTIGFYRLPD